MSELTREENSTSFSTHIRSSVLAHLSLLLLASQKRVSLGHADKSKQDLIEKNREQNKASQEDRKISSGFSTDAAFTCRSNSTFCC